MSDRADLLLWCVRGGAYNRLCLRQPKSVTSGGSGASNVMQDHSLFKTVVLPRVCEVKECLRSIGVAKSLKTDADQRQARISYLQQNR